VGFSRFNKIPRCSAYDSKPRVAAVMGAQYGFSRHNKILHCSAYAIGENSPVPASGPGSEVNQFVHVLTRNISSSMHAFLSNLAHRQTDRQTDKQTRAHGRKHIPPPLSEVNKHTAHYLSIISTTTMQPRTFGRLCCQTSCNRTSIISGLYCSRPCSVS